MNRYTVSDSEEWRVCLLARWGFAYKYIAKRVFRSEDEHKRVAAVLHRNKLRVRDYRDGSNSEAKGLVKKVMK